MNNGLELGDYAIIPYGRNYIILYAGEQIEFAKTFKEAKAKIKTGTLTNNKKCATMKNKSRTT